MAVLDQPGDNCLPGHSFNGCLASSVDIRNQNDIGIVEARAETIEEVQYAREAMRLAAQKLPVHTKFVMREEREETDDATGEPEALAPGVSDA